MDKCEFSKSLHMATGSALICDQKMDEVVVFGLFGLIFTYRIPPVARRLSYANQ